MKIGFRSSWRNGCHPFRQVKKERLVDSPLSCIRTFSIHPTFRVVVHPRRSFLIYRPCSRSKWKTLVKPTNHPQIQFPTPFKLQQRYAHTSNFIPHSSLLMAGQPPHQMSQNTNGLPLMYHPQPHTPFPALQQQLSNGERIDLGPLSGHPPANDLESTDGSGHGSTIQIASVASPLPALVASPLPPHMLTTAAMESMNTGVSSPSNMPEIPEPVCHSNLLQIPKGFRYNMLTVIDTASHRSILEHRVVRQFPGATTGQRTQYPRPYRLLCPPQRRFQWTTSRHSHRITTGRLVLPKALHRHGDCTTRYSLYHPRQHQHGSSEPARP